MSSEKDKIKKQIADQKSKLATVNKKIEELEKALIRLNALSFLHVDWVATSHSSIKHTYFLAGKPYSEMSDDEESIVKTLNVHLSGEQYNMTRVVESALQQAKNVAMNINNTVSFLQGLHDFIKD